jgi:heme exporter protein D
VVEHASPGCDNSNVRQTDNRRADADSDADYARGVLAVLGGGCAYPVAMHYFRERAERFSIRGGWGLMNWPDLSMSGYGFYVWGSYIFSLVVIVWEVVSLKQRKKALTLQQSSNTVPASVLRGSANETTS